MNENNNFGLKDVIEYYEKQGYIFYNLSNIKTLKNYIDFEKYKRINKNKLITYIECSSSYNKETTKFNKRFINILLKLFNYKNNHKYGKNAIIFFYNKKFYITYKRCISNIRYLLDIEYILFNKYYKCNICFNEKCIRISSCIQCNFQICDICDKKLKKINNNCCCCKYNYTKL